MNLGTYDQYGSHFSVWIQSPDLHFIFLCFHFPHQFSVSKVGKLSLTQLIAFSFFNFWVSLTSVQFLGFLFGNWENGGMKKKRDNNKKTNIFLWFGYWKVLKTRKVTYPHPALKWSQDISLRYQEQKILHQSYVAKSFIFFWWKKHTWYQMFSCNAMHFK